MAKTPSIRSFLDLNKNRPLLRTVAEGLAEEHTHRGVLDLEDVIVAFPGRRAGRRFLEILLDCADEKRLRVSPPRITTVGRLPELLVTPGVLFPPAGRTLRRWAWVRAFLSAKDEERNHLLPAAFTEDGLSSWIRLADDVDRLRREVGAGMAGFADVPRKAGNALPAGARERWRALAALHGRYLSILKDTGFADPWDRLIEAVRSGPEAFRRDRTAVLVGAVDLTPLQKAVLQQVAEKVIVLVAAPGDRAGSFDPWGCVIPEQWEKPEIPIPETCIHLVDGPEDMVDLVLRLFHGFAHRYGVDQVTVGVGEEAVYPALERRLEEAGVPSHPAAGIPLSTTPPVKLLRATAEVLEERSFHALATLVRHPDFMETLGWVKGEEASRVLADLDAFHVEHLPSRTPLSVLPGSGDQGKGSFETILYEVDRLLAPFQGSDRRPPGGWCEPVLAFLRTVYGSLDEGMGPEARMKVRACLAVAETLSEYMEGEKRLAAPMEIEAAAGLRLLLRDLEEEEGIPRDADPNAVELLGWLELPLDDAPALVVTGLNEGFVPDPIPLHPDLPDGLRKKLGLPRNASRFARDACFLDTLYRTRKELHVTAARRSVEGDSLAPSRLLFARKKGRSLARLVRRLHEAGENPLPFVVKVPPEPAESTGFSRPEPVCRYARKTISVTAFAKYLRSPYLFYLEEVLRLGAVDDGARELDPMAFGSLAHTVLARFGKGPARDAKDPVEIRKHLDRLLEAEMAARFGPFPLPAVRIQQEQLKQRLRVFAEQQAEWRKMGWRILYVEQGFGEKEWVSCPGRLPRPLYLAGRIDRIDRNEKTGEWAIFDYKTGEQAQDPKAARGSDGEWHDLQLPLYRYLFHRLVPDADRVHLGYICLPNDSTEEMFRLAEWKPEELAEALHVAAHTAEAVQRGAFHEMGRFEPGDPVLRDLCGLGMLLPLEGREGEEP